MTPLHIPDAELHAYLDQALPRSRCVTIESHLAGCIRCRLERDAIAALRDRTTHLLATLRPVRRRIPPSFEELSRRAPSPPAVRPTGRWLRAAAWAASVLGALGLGYAAHDGRHADGGAVREVAARPAALAPAARHGEPPAPPGASAPAPAGSRRAAAPTPPAPATLAAVNEAPAPDRDAAFVPTSLEVSSDTLPTDAPSGDGLWRTVDWREAREQVGTEPPRVDGVPVVQVQVQPARDRSGALTVVAQQLHSGEMIATIEGPVDDVWALLSRRGDADGAAGAQTVQQGARLLAVTGQLPADSLRAMVRRVNAASRVR
jgi:hypothetical protein